MAARCPGKNCKFTEGFTIPHSPECRAVPHPDDTTHGPNNVEVMNPGHPAVSELGSAEYMKLLALAMAVLDVDEVLITPETIEETDFRNRVLCIASLEEGVLLKLITREEAEEIAAAEKH